MDANDGMCSALVLLGLWYNRIGGSMSLWLLILVCLMGQFWDQLNFCTSSPMGKTYTNIGVSFHFNADGTKINLPISSTSDPGMLSSLDFVMSKAGFINIFSSWTQKTETLFIGCQHKANHFYLPLVLDHIEPVARNLGSWFVNISRFEQHTTKLVLSCFYHLRNISKCHYCNSLFTKTPDCTELCLSGF